MSFLKNKYSSAVTLALLLQALAYYAVAARRELTPIVAPLSSFPTVLDGWGVLRDIPIEKEVQDVLRADDTLNREYGSQSANSRVFFFVAFFKTQRYGQAPHSPKNCLPGSGWEPSESSEIEVPVRGWPVPIAINRYVVSHGNEKSVVLYWYQSHNRVVASEYSAKFWLVADSIRYRRSDTALVRIVVPIHENNAKAATDSGLGFIRAVFPRLLQQLST